jgi:hypothetical protein
MNNLERSSFSEWGIAFQDVQDDDRKLRLHDQMLACLAWVLETTTKLHPTETNLDDIYRAYDFVSEKRAELENHSRVRLS